MAYAEYIQAKNETRTIRDINGQKMLATIEASTTASKAYAVGDYLIVNDKLYTVTTAIASGGAITVGTNVTETKVGTELSELNRQISESITPAIEEIETALDTKAPAIYETASGDIASFADGADGMSVKSLVANIEPVQDLHGYESPWPAGGGKNLLPMLINDIKSANTSGAWAGNTYTFYGVTFAFSVNDGGAVTAIAASGTATAGTDIVIINQTGSLPNWITAGTTYTISGNATSARLEIIPRTGSTYQNTKTNTSFSWDSSWDGVYIRIRVDNGTTASGTLYPMVESGSTATTFSPYSNICPISGHTGVSLTRTGVNVWDEEWENGYINGSGGLSNYEFAIRSKNYCACKPNTTYQLKVQTTMTGYAVAWYTTNKQFIDRIVNERIVTAPNDAYFFKMSLYNYKSDGRTEYLHDVSFNYPSTDNDYHEGHVQSISITFPTEAGTVYGGTLTLNPDRTGTLVVDKKIVDLGTLTWNWSSSDRFFDTMSIASEIKKPANNNVIGDILCSEYKSATNEETYSKLVDSSISVATTGRIRVYSSQFDRTGSTSVLQGIQLVYGIANPITYQLTSEQISGILSTLYGTNNIWSDVGDTTVGYPADTKLYFDGKIAEAIAAALNA